MIETLSMKGLTLNCMDRKSEAYELVRQGLKVCCLWFYLIYLSYIAVCGMIQLWFLFWYRMTLKVMFAGMFMVSFTDQTENTGRRSSAIEMHWK